MLTRAVRAKLLVFFVISVVIVTVTSIYYVRLPHLLGFGQYSVTAEFSDASGVYTNAIVTYRGTDVGRVGTVGLTSTGTTVALDIDDGIKIPADLTASIHSTSAVGEQYVDLVPKPDGADRPLLHDGSVIDQSDTRTLPSTDALITELNKLVATLPKQTVANTLDDLATALNGAGPDLQLLLDSASKLLNTAKRNVGPTTRLLNGLGPFLQTQQDIAGETTSTVRDLKSFSHQLVLSNDDIVSLLHQTPQVAKQVIGVADDLSPTLTVLLTNLTSTGKVLNIYDPAVRQVLTVYPALLAGLIDFAQGSAKTGLIPLSFHLNVNLPPACVQGFESPAERRDPSITSEKTTRSGLYCKQAPSAPPSVRGTRNLPCLNNPGVRAATPADCLGITEAQAQRRYDDVQYTTVTGGQGARSASAPRAGSSAASASAQAGQAKDIVAMMQSVARSSGKETTWQDLLIGPTK